VKAVGTVSWGMEGRVGWETDVWEHCKNKKRRGSKGKEPSALYRKKSALKYYLMLPRVEGGANYKGKML